MTTYEYDEAGRLIKKNTSTGHERRFDFDQAGNRREATSELPNIPPVAVNDSYTMMQNDREVFDLVLNDTDADGPKSALSVSSIHNVQHTTPKSKVAYITLLENGSVEVVALQGGGVSFDYTLSDGEDTDTGRVVIDVEGEPSTCGDIFCLPDGGLLGAIKDIVAAEETDAESTQAEEVKP
ncbi:Ig-like domain-containing protein [Parvularcula maris]|uniref:Ig-like domain-containing protein n=1 Tax=Parvularcula maris TaxID=2965077 RepID=A0A9X2RIZ6_9PROT|nr:Ig-like domain-containing protein [Parvularcula maris]